MEAVIQRSREWSKQNSAFVLLLGLISVPVVIGAWFVHANVRGWAYLPPVGHVARIAVISFSAVGVVQVWIGSAAYLVWVYGCRFVRRRRVHNDLCWRCKYPYLEFATRCSECGGTRQVPEPLVSSWKILLIASVWFGVSVIGIAAGEITIRSEDLDFKNEINKWPAITRNYDRKFPARGFSLHYVPGRAVWVND